jgi:hypothetical protein
MNIEITPRDRYLETRVGDIKRTEYCLKVDGIVRVVGATRDELEDLRKDIAQEQE